MRPVWIDCSGCSRIARCAVVVEWVTNNGDDDVNKYWRDACGLGRSWEVFWRANKL